MSVFVDAVLAAKTGHLNVLGLVGSLVKHFGAFAALPEEVRSNQMDAAEAIGLHAARLIAGLVGAPEGD